MGVDINGRDIPPCIMLDGEHLKLSFNMGSKCDNEDPDERITAFLHFVLDDKGFRCTAALAGRNAANVWLETAEVPCRNGQNLDPSEFGEIIGDVTIPKGAIVNLAFGKPHEINIEELRQELLTQFHEHLEKFDIVANCQWDNDDLHLYVSMGQFGAENLRFDFEIPYESALIVLQDRRRKTA